MRRSTTSKQKSEWLVFIAEEERRTTHQDYYLAQIAAEIRRGNTKPEKIANVRDKDFLIEFKEPEVTNQSTTPMDSKAFWLTSLGVKHNGI